MVELTRRFGVRPRPPWYDIHVTVDNLKGETRVNGKALCVRRGLALLCDRAEMGALVPAHLSNVGESRGECSRLPSAIGRLLPLGGTEGVALLFTTLVELVSGFGLAGEQHCTATETSNGLRRQQREVPSRSQRWRPYRGRELRNRLRISLSVARGDLLQTLPEGHACSAREPSRTFVQGGTQPSLKRPPYEAAYSLWNPSWGSSR